jgi:hypothetical protein
VLVTRDVEPSYFSATGFDPAPICWATPATERAIDALYASQAVFFAGVIAAEDRSKSSLRALLRRLGLRGAIALDQVALHLREMGAACDPAVIDQYRGVPLSRAA